MFRIKAKKNHRAVIQALPRRASSKQLKKLRSEGLLPVQLYGQDIESRSLQVNLAEFEKTFDQTGETNLLDLQIGDVTHQVYIRNLHFSNGSQVPIHADFYYIDLKQSNAGSDAINTTNILPPPGQSLFKLSFAAVSLLLLFLIPTIMYVQQVEQKEIPATQTKKVLGVKAKSDTQKLPMRLIIPAISVNTNIQHVGITPEGEMDVPSNSIDVGWFEPGALPGEKGSAVIAGHFDSENGEAGVFNNLDKLKVGDKIYTKDNSGKSTTFAVKKKRLYDPGYAEEVFGRSDTAHLNLITCKGVWNDNLKSYSKRLVVFADRQ